MRDLRSVVLQEVALGFTLEDVGAVLLQTVELGENISERHLVKTAEDLFRPLTLEADWAHGADLGSIRIFEDIVCFISSVFVETSKIL